MTKRSVLGLKTSVSYKLVHFAENAKGFVPSAKSTKRSDLGIKTLFCTKSCTLLKSAKKLYAQSENEKTCWSWAENAILYKLVHFAENR